MMKNCLSCGSNFEITPDDLAFLEKASPLFAGKQELIPPPTHCPDCRQQRRLAQANQLYLYKRRCDFSGRSIISNIHPDSPHKVYRLQEWHSDAWDPLEYGRAFDFSRPFFEQFGELLLAVPKPSLHTGFEYDENSEYCNYAGKNKNCYFLFDSDEDRDCLYCYSLNSSSNCLDCYRVRKSELCAECIDCEQCYHCHFQQDCSNCSDSAFLKNCIGCKHCLMCCNLQNKEYHVENKPVSKEIFEQYFSSLRSRKTLETARQHFVELKLRYPQKASHGVQNENSLGGYLSHCKNAFSCFDSFDLWDCRYVHQAFMPLKDCMDTQECGDGELYYESAFCGYHSHSVLFCSHCLGDASDLLYCVQSPHSNHLFGCVGMLRKSYCILNTQYTKEEYEKLVPKIIGHMRKTGEYGEYFLMALSMFAYNESLAQEYYPLSKETVKAKGLTWRPKDAKEFAPSSTAVPDSIGGTDTTICDQILACRQCSRNYKIVQQELLLLQKLNMPPPELCFYCRHDRRRNQRNPRKLWQRSCQKCGGKIASTYAPDRPEIVYCERCFLESIS